MLEDSTAQVIATVAISLGIPALLASSARTAWKWWTGRAGRERARNNSLAAIADTEAVKRRKAQEYASLLRRQLTEAGLEPEPWPEELTVPRIKRSRPGAGDNQGENR